MLAVSAIIGVILGTILFGILMHRFTYYVPAKDAIGFFIRKWMMCCGVGIFIVYALLTIIGEILEPILPWLFVIGGIIVIIIVILVAVVAVSKAAEKKSSGEEKIKNPQPEQSSPAGKMQKETGITAPSTPQPALELHERPNQQMGSEDQKCPEPQPMVSQPVPEPQSMSESRPMPVSQPVPEPQSMSEPQPMPEPQPVSEPQPTPEPQLTLEPQSMSESQLVSGPQPVAGVGQPMMPPQPIREIPLQQNQETVQNGNDKTYATAALTLGIISVAMTPCGIFGGILGLIGLIFAVLANEKSTKRGWALGLNIAGMSIGIIATIIWFGLLMP